MKELSWMVALAMAGFLIVPVGAEEKKYVPEAGSPELQKKAAKKGKVTVDPELPYVLIIGDSISVGYTGIVRAELDGKANVIHNRGNAQGTTNGLAFIEEWLAEADWDVIHFNFGLHDLKRVTEAGTANNSNDPDDPYQADLATYTANLKKIVALLVETDTKLIFATTTPFPSGVKPYRSPEDAGNYNEAALKIMKKHKIEVNDLYGLVQPDLETLQKPVNVHFQKAGSELMGKQVAARIEAALAR
jgi:acyl-CoA thioesterase-1